MYGLLLNYCFFFFFNENTAYEMRISDWSSDVCSSDLPSCYRPAGPTVCGDAAIWVASSFCNRSVIWPSRAARTAPDQGIGSNVPGVIMTKSKLDRKRDV